MSLHHKNNHTDHVVQAPAESSDTHVYKLLNYINYHQLQSEQAVSNSKLLVD